jgi:transposase-like protein
VLGLWAFFQKGAVQMTIQNFSDKATKAMVIEDESSFDFDGVHCPTCNSAKIVKTGDSKGQDTGDDGMDYDFWKCKDCKDSWAVEQ